MRCRSCAPVPEEVRRAADLLERRWTVAILWAAHEGGALRFNEFRSACGRIPPRTLSERLSDLEQAGVLERVVIDSRPPRAEYRLTERGRALRALLDALASWAGPRRPTAATETR